MPTSKNSDSSVACQKFVQSILELPATDEIHMEDRKKVWPELSPELIRPMAYAVRKAVINKQPSCAKTATFESRTNKMKNVSEEKHNAMTNDIRDKNQQCTVLANSSDQKTGHGVTI